MVQTLKTLCVFISFPGDVAEERVLAIRVIQRLQGEFASFVTIEPIFWEHEPLLLESYKILQTKRGEDDDYTMAALNCIIELYEAWRKPNKAAEHRSMLPGPSKPLK